VQDGEHASLPAGASGTWTCPLGVMPQLPADNTSLTRSRLSIAVSCVPAQSATSAATTTNAPGT